MFISMGNGMMTGKSISSFLVFLSAPVYSVDEF